MILLLILIMNCKTPIKPSNPQKCSKENWCNSGDNKIVHPQKIMHNVLCTKSGEDRMSLRECIHNRSNGWRSSWSCSRNSADDDSMHFPTRSHETDLMRVYYFKFNCTYTLVLVFNFELSVCKQNICIT